MGTTTAYQFFSKLKKDHFCLAYMGVFDDDLTETLMRNNETSIQEPQKLKKRLAFLIAECFQNIIRHSDDPAVIESEAVKPKIFILRNIGNVHYISSTNLILNSKKEDLEVKLRSINTLSLDELKTIYLGALANNQMTEKGGGGLGLIEMARKSGSPLDFAFDLINELLSVFYFQVRFTQKEKGEEDNALVVDTNELVPITETKELYDLMLAQKIVLLRKGDFSQDSILPIIGLIEGNLKLLPNFSGSKKKTMYVLIEILQNISKHAQIVNGEREGILLISQKENNYVLTTGNYINKNHVAELKGKLDSVVNLSPMELTELYKTILLKGEVTERGNAGIGLVELCKYSKNKINYSFEDVDEVSSFYSLSIEV
jgi:hypothetical protein